MSVHWVVDRALGRTDPMGGRGDLGYEALLNALTKTNTSYDLVRKPPFADYLIGLGDDHTPVELDLSGPVFVVGTTSMGLVSEKHGWSPGYVEGTPQDTLLAHWGSHLLNHDSLMAPLEDIDPPWAEFFIRPVEDTKSFAGTIMKRDEFLDWRGRVCAGKNAFVTLNGPDAVMVAPWKPILAEYRLYVMDGVIVTGSRYRLGSRIFYTTDLDPAMISFAKERIAEYCPSRAMCLDIAQIASDDVRDRYKVIETNSISSAGFYACDMQIFVNSINEMYG